MRDQHRTHDGAGQTIAVDRVHRQSRGVARIRIEQEGALIGRDPELVATGSDQPTDTP